MCSGTESPLLALEMVRDALRSMSLGTIEVEHLFSAEIVPYKQAYIERNFAPPIIFRDITEFTEAVKEDYPVATTAYGARVPIPGNPDILIAGTSCVDYSRLNNSKKSLGAGGESSETWFGALSYCKKYRPAIIIFENIQGADWYVMLKHYRDEGYECDGVIVTSKDYYIPHTRQRGYMVCFDRKRSEKSINGMTAKWQDLMEKLRRPASSPASAFLLPSDALNTKQTAVDENVREVDWSQCEITQMQYRVDKKLGHARPFTKWQESGAKSVPEGSDKVWYDKQVERVLDTIDCATMRKALPTKDGGGMYDARFKTRIWNLSQNVYRDEDTQMFGITGCITPSGAFFLSDAGRAMAPEETLILQGLPLEKISFTTESSAEIQDMAGNAMTTTVVGSALLAALIAGHKLMGGSADTTAMDVDMPTPPAAQALIEDTPTRTVSASESGDAISITELLQIARRTLRRCRTCEGSRGLSEKALQRCQDCEHTTCIACGGNPEHNFQQAPSLTLDRCEPFQLDDFAMPKLPLRLSVTDVPSIQHFAASSSVKPSLLKRYVEAATQSASRTFAITGIRRTHCWTVTYSSTDARLELIVDDTRAEWRLFAIPDKSLAGDDWLRAALRQPVAKSGVTTSLTEGQWTWRIPIDQSVPSTITGSGAAVPTWWRRQGLPDYSHHTQREMLTVDGKLDSVAEYCIAGTYKYLPRCGMACDSLYVKTDTAAGERPIYLFLDPDRTGESNKDEFVFAHNKSWLEHDEVRPIIARVKAPWRPWTTNTQSVVKTAVSIMVDAAWESAGSQKLSPVVSDIQAQLPTKVLHQTAVTVCEKAQLLMSCVVPVTSGHGGNPQIANKAFDLKFLAQHTWVFEAMRRQLPTNLWQEVQLQETTCKTCAPSKPLLRWRLAADGLTVQPYEDHESAAKYERSIKARPAPLVITMTAAPSRTDIVSVALGVNLASLAHRAISRLPEGPESPSVTWKLDTYNSTSDAKLKDFRLRETTGVEPYEKELDMVVKLFPKQALCLTWMKAQEEGVKFVLEEAEESAMPVLGWRAEVRASATLNVRGGICADHPGFGKTITSLALIQSEFLEMKPEAILHQLKSRQGGPSAGLIASTATVIVCPNTLHPQWISEINEKLRYRKGVLAISTTTSLSKFTIDDFKNARIIVVNRQVLGSQTYAEQFLAPFIGAPGPATKSGRGFANWLQFAREQIPECLRVLREGGEKKLKEYVRAKYKEHVAGESFKAAVPSRRLRGANYVAAKAKGSSSNNLHDKAAAAALDTTNIGKPLFEMFYFNRIIVDEFHIFEPKEYAAITMLQADKHWGLSATPALSDLYDVAQMAGLLGVRLRIGSDAKGLMKAKNARALAKDMTDFELFDAMRSTPSSTMHARMHEIDQLFLDAFVRRNVMDFTQMEYDDHLVPVTLDLDHRAFYTELSQHLNSADMKIRKKKRGKVTDRDERLRSVVATSETPEEALSKQASYWTRDENDFADDAASGLRALITVRENEEQDIMRKLAMAVSAARVLEAKNFDGWKETRLTKGELGDDETIAKVKRIVQSADTVNKAVAAKTLASLQREAKEEEGDEDDESGGRAGSNRATSALKGLDNRLLVSRRSIRYLKNLEMIQQAAQTNASLDGACSNPTCTASTDATTPALGVSTSCGHAICRTCHTSTLASHCPSPDCKALMHPYNLLWTSKLGNLASPTHTIYGAKITAAVEILEQIKSLNDQAILFVQYATQLDEVGRALADANIPCTIVRDSADAGRQIASFRDTPSRTVIVLNASDETAAGSNLQCANHVLFLAPLIRDSQYGYDSTMAQAIGRIRRHGQQKAMHVYRIVALDTIDVDILEHRERRATALVEQGAEKLEPPPSKKNVETKERTQLVKEGNQFSLRPQSWLVGDGAELDESTGQRVKGAHRVSGWEDFSALVTFSKAYIGGDE